MKKKTGIIVSIIIVLIALIAVGTFTLLYFMTDIFKSNQELFWKYTLKGSQLVKAISNENEESQKAWKESHSYTAKGDLSISVTKGTGTQTVKLGTTEKHNKNTGRTYSDITLYNEEAELLKASYINSEDIHALYCKDIYEPYYIGFHSNDLENLIKKFSTPEEAVASIYDFDLSKIMQAIKEVTPEEKEYLYDTYYNVIISSIPETKYAKIGKTTININNQNYETLGYRVQLNQDDFKQIVISILTKAKEDERTIEIIKNILGNTEKSDIINVIEQMVTALQDSSLNEMKLIISVYNARKGLTEIQLSDHSTMNLTIDIDDRNENKKNVAIKVESINEENPELTTGMQVSMEKQILSNMVFYTSTITNGEEGNKITISTSLGNVINGKIENNSKITILNDGATVETSYYKTIQEETEEVDVQELKDSSAIIVNNYPKEQLENFFNGISNTIEEIIPEKISQLNIQMTDSQDGLYYLDGIISSVFVMMNANGVPNAISTAGMSIASSIKQTVLLNSNIANSISGEVSSFAQQEKQVFNQRFETYKGEEINGTLVKNLLSSIITSNTSNAEENDKIVKVRLDGNKIKKPKDWNEQGESDSTKLSQLRNSISAGTKYNVVIEYNAKGFVEIITIFGI